MYCACSEILLVRNALRILLFNQSGAKPKLASRNLACARFSRLARVAFSPQIPIGLLVSYACRD